jgi:hypothetical protein
MALPKKSASRSWSPSQAVFILERALKDRKLSAADIRGYIGSIADEIRSIEKRLASLKDTAVESVTRVLGRGGEVPVPHVRSRRARKGPRRAKRAVSPEVAASRKLQGQYIAAIRQIPKIRRKKFAAIAKKDGREAAIAAIKKAAGK